MPMSTVAQLPSSGCRATAMSLPLVTVMPAACMFAAAQTRMAMEMMPPRPMDRTQSKRASAICSGSLKRSDAPEACRNRLYGTMVVPIRPTAVRMPLAPAWPSGREGVNRPATTAPQSTGEANAVIRNTRPMKTTMPVRIFSTSL